MLTATAINAEQQTFNEIVADTLTFDEYAEWLSINQKFEAKETRQKEQFTSCMESGKDSRFCKDPHYCLYPKHENEQICYNSVTK